MTTFVQQNPSDKKLIPFLKLGAFDENNYRPAELKKAKDNEEKYGTLRLLPGETVAGTISSFHDTANGEVMYIKECTIARLIDGGSLEEKVGAVKIGLSTDLKYKVKIQKKKEPNQSVVIEYLGKQVSPKDATRELHKVNVE